MRVVITGGGTGGHLFPALAVHGALIRRRPDAQVLFVGASEGVEATILPRLGHAFRGLPVHQVKGRRWRGQMAALLALPAAVRQASGLLREFGAQAVLGVGGYASFPTVLAARLRRTPTVIHEQNAYPGLANRWLGRIASAVAVSFEAAAGFFPAGRVSVTGNPVRPEIRPGDAGEARRRLALSAGRFTVLIFGGSQGAHRVNAAAIEALPRLAASRGRIQFLHATGEREVSEVRQAYEQHGFPARVEPFFQDMATAYAAADFVIARGGASTIFELAAVGKPALLVPYPYAANDHQRLNAEVMVKAGAAWTVPDQYCDGQRIAATVQAALEKPELLRRMGEQAQGLARPDAADRIVDLLERVAKCSVSELH
ncbi:MAG: undecaprenyldiphospho-muramoylpentapeptide beta-N-acetylglucosaminyltransferase [Candidatus Rokubacteria bacterium RIFCSPLOWO2_12_FULL_69_21]|nr:MAG: undecaprenyldiphospho-muramoylpentapeptide beta-N-acetylglucosaminyltransferase [Candidatus Rokubacteria bacterium RIFCSPLOWO2_12_FULL_69_21]